MNLNTLTQLANLITESLCSVIIVEITDRQDITRLTDKLSVLSGYNLFVDDMQTQFSVFINKLLELSADKNVWIAGDYVQAWSVLYQDSISIVANILIDILTSHQITTLSMNLRNTHDLSNILCEIRDQLVKLCSLKSDILDLILPTQS